jgi:hypothetical protein
VTIIEENVFVTLGDVACTWIFTVLFEGGGGGGGGFVELEPPPHAASPTKNSSTAPLAKFNDRALRSDLMGVSPLKAKKIAKNNSEVFINQLTLRKPVPAT